ncbi:hypothetical protein J2X06_001797 [Lysobacter niastensis]|uniref:Uncharacterized protein n=1 Tax=Lysobacter niastensis TaxID=380629 RepID=A0ABU1WAM4_9GAMM|nr:hypothetical protein [Lysobacter niastensis]MDR7134613.1 hypothetical protein [Lysobacter niastensis]
MRPTHFIPISAAIMISAAAAVSAGTARAEQPQLLPELAQEPAQAALGSPIALGALDALRGGATTVDNDILVDGNVQDNTADHVLTGNNTVDAGSFANASGISTVIQNTGANVLIQNATIVNVQFAPPPSP